jgi:hypothetical protein
VCQGPVEIVPGQYCLCGRNPVFTGVWGVVETGDQRRQRFLRKLDSAVRILRVLADDDATLAHVLPLHTSDIGSVIHRWTLNLALPARESSADAWWRGHRFQRIRRVEQAPWLDRAARRGAAACASPTAVVPGRSSMDSCARGRPVEILVGSIDA